jgi:hypothetical protein
MMMRPKKLHFRSPQFSRPHHRQLYRIYISRHTMARFTTAIFAAAVVGMSSQDASAFMNAASSDRPSTSLSAEQFNRRDAFMGIAALGTFLAAGAEPAEAKYSEYTHREQDWEQRQKGGEIQYSSARDLKRQLVEIAPQNAGNPGIFCPNGPSSAVSPLMENQCGDRMAIPSVYGRSNDAMGNSIPGYKSGYAWGEGEGSSMSAAVGGFPKYKENEFKIREYKN